MVRERESFSNSKLFPPIRLVLPAGETISQPPLSATLGQAQINSSDFCKQFNTLSLINYFPGVLLNVTVTKCTDNTLDIKIRNIFLPFIFFQAIQVQVKKNRRRRRIYLETLYDIFQLCETFRTVNNRGSKINSARSFFGTLKSCRVKVKL